MHNGIAVSTAEQADTALTLLELSGEYDLIVVDTVGRSDGLHLLRQLRSVGVSTAQILMMVSQSHPEDGLYCIQAGADDFVTKPVVMDELVVRMEALLQRSTSSSDGRHRGHTVQGLTLDFETRTCYREGKHVDLTTREFDLLHHLFERRGRTVSREGLVEGVWGRPHAISPRTVDRHVTAIRRKIEVDPSMPVYLQTIYGEGYRFMPTE
jgi:two-component system phosphate regulon response regulator OmpR